MIEIKLYKNEKEYIEENYKDFCKIDEILKFSFKNNIQLGIKLMNTNQLNMIFEQKKYLDSGTYEFPCGYIDEMYNCLYDKINIHSIEYVKNVYDRNFLIFKIRACSGNDYSYFFLSSPMLDIEFINSLLLNKIKFRGEYND